VAKIAGVEVETKVSLTGLVGFLVAIITLIGFLYKADYRISSIELEQAQMRNDEVTRNQKLDDTLSQLGLVMGEIKQVLRDHNMGIDHQ
jgi:hypothetical protein